MSTHAEPRPAPRQREAGVPQVDITHSTAAEQLAIAVHVDVPANYRVPAGLKANIAEAVQAIVFPGQMPEAEEEQES
jgi:hypothetical protein